MDRNAGIAQMEMTTQDVPEAYAGLPYHSSIKTEGGIGPYNVTITGDLPPGVLYDVGLSVITFSGIPSTPGSYNAHISVADVNGATVSRDYAFNVRPLNSFSNLPVNISDAEKITTTDNNFVFFPAVIGISEKITVTDGLTDYGSARIALPEAMHINDSTKVLLAAQVALPEAMHISDATSIKVALGIIPTTALAGTYNTAYTATIFQSAGATGAATLTESGTLPTGMQISAPGNALLLYGTPTQTGTFPFTITAKDSANTSVVYYTLIISTASQTISIGTLPTPTYGGPTFSLTATASPSGLPVTIASTSALATGSNPFTPANAGLASFQASQAGNANYAAATAVNFNVSIAKASLTAVATNTSRAFDQPNPIFNYSLATFVNGDSASVVSGSPTITTAATPISPVTTYPITLAVGTLSAANYNIGAAPGTLTIIKAPQTITFYPLPTLTHGTTFPLSARASSGLTVTYSVSGPATISNNILSVSGTGLVQVTAAQIGNTNYSSATSVIRSFTAQ